MRLRLIAMFIQHSNKKVSVGELCSLRDKKLVQPFRKTVADWQTVWQVWLQYMFMVCLKNASLTSLNSLETDDKSLS